RQIMSSLEGGLPSGWELMHESFRAAFGFKDQDGRPLGEANAPEESQRGIEIDWRECRYQGSRYRHPKHMNVSALRQITDNWEDLIIGSRYLRKIYLSHFGVGLITHNHAWRLAKIATMLPIYLLSRPKDRFMDGQLPVLVAALFKVVAGVFQ